MIDDDLSTPTGYTPALSIWNFPFHGWYTPLWRLLEQCFLFRSGEHVCAMFERCLRGSPACVSSRAGSPVVVAAHVKALSGRDLITLCASGNHVLSAHPIANSPSPSFLFPRSWMFCSAAVASPNRNRSDCNFRYLSPDGCEIHESAKRSRVVLLLCVGWHVLWEVTDYCATKKGHWF